MTGEVFEALGYLALVGVFVLCMVLYNRMLNKKDKQLHLVYFDYTIKKMKDDNHKSICYDEEGKLQCVCKVGEIFEDFLNGMMDIHSNLKELKDN